MLKHLYRVGFTGVCYVMAKTPMDAEMEAKAACMGDPKGAGLQTECPMLVTKDEILAEEWDGLCVPFGIDRGEPELTLGQILGSME